MATISKFEDLIIWQLAEQQEKEIYQLSKIGTFSKDFELINQIHRSSGSVMDNIAEGFGRGGNREFINFLSIARGSNDEVRSQLYRAKNRGHITSELLDELCLKNNNLGGKISNFIGYLNQCEIKGQKFRK
jgi:four helix bundle protein